MIANNEPKLDYSDVLIVPNISEVKSRKDVSLEVRKTFKNGIEWSGVPVMAANMSTVGTHKMALVLSEYNIVTCLRKGGDYYSSFVSSHPDKEKYVSLTLGFCPFPAPVFFFKIFLILSALNAIALSCRSFSDS